MADFSHLRKLDATEETLAEYVFDDIVMARDAEGQPVCPSIFFAPMTDANIAYLNERIRMSVERAEAANRENKAQRRSRILSSDQLEEDRDLDRILMARCCAKRWGVAPVDVNGDTPEFSEENCLSFLRALPNYIIDPLRGWVSNIYNFVDREALVGRISEAGKDALGNG